MLQRPNNRAADELRPISLNSDISRYAEGSCEIQLGHTLVRCTASIEENVPRWLKGSGKGWITAEYGMLPRSTHSRMNRESAQGRQSGRTQEIQRLIGRALRAVVDMELLGERQIIIDCDVIEADGGTRTAAITGGFVALYKALELLMKQEILEEMPIKEAVAAISCGVVKSQMVLDLEYEEDSVAEVDANFVLTESGKLVEVQATAEGAIFSEQQLQDMISLAKSGVTQLIAQQKTVLGL